MASTPIEIARCPKCGSERIRKEKLGSSLASGVFVIGLTIFLLWPNFSEIFVGWKIAGVVAVIVALNSIWSGVSILIGKRVPLAKCRDCNYEWPWG